MNEEKRSELSDMGEFGLIDHLTKNIKLKNKSSLYGVGDDAAVISSGDNLTLVSTDLLVEGVHFDLSYIPLKHLGYKAAIVNFSDIYAMGGTPEQITVGLAVSNRYSLEAIDEIYNGLKQACDAYGVDLVGGDTTSSLSGLFLSITVIGRASEDEVVYRNTAKEHDLLCVSGDLGAAYMGLLVLEREKKVFEVNPAMQPDLEGMDYILERQLKPEARNDIGKMLKGVGIRPTSMIDISDGLASDVKHLCKGSKLGCQIYTDKLPIDAVTMSVAAEFQIDPNTAVMNGGEDYELLFTIKADDYEKIKDISGIAVIGHMTEEAAGMNLISPDGKSISIQAQGWDGLKDKL
ncbi:MAG: thiamine-phosphate kinase [Bacteroidetes bacterium]|nr:MAG: thiamine-phosphate kinase [Bacteroidota bacterium]